MKLGLPSSEATRLCGCGNALAACIPNPGVRATVRRLIDRQGPDIAVQTPAWACLVPRSFIAAHGLKSTELRDLAQHFGWPALSYDWEWTSHTSHTDEK